MTRRPGRLGSTFLTYLHAPSRTEPGMARPGGDSIAVLLPVPNLRGRVDWAREADGLRDALVGDLERTFGLEGLDDSVVVERRMTPLDFRDELGAVDGNAFSVEPTLHGAPGSGCPTATRRSGGSTTSAAGRTRARGCPASSSGPRSRPASSPRTTPGPPGRSEDGLVLLQRPEPEADALLAEARSTTRRVGRTFALACRLLPADVRDDVYRLYLVFRTLDDLVDEHAARAPAAVAAVEAWCEDGSVGSREAAVLADLATRHDLPRHALRDFCHGMRDDLEGRPVRTEADVDRYCYRVAGTVGVVMAAVLGTNRPGADRQAAALGMAMQRTNILRDLDEDRALGRRYVAQETLGRSTATCAPAGARRSCATRSPGPTRSTTRAWRGSAPSGGAASRTFTAARDAGVSRAAVSIISESGDGPASMQSRIRPFSGSSAKIVVPPAAARRCRECKALSGRFAAQNPPNRCSQRPEGADLDPGTVFDRFMGCAY